MESHSYDITTEDHTHLQLYSVLYPPFTWPTATPRNPRRKLIIKILIKWFVNHFQWTCYPSLVKNNNPKTLSLPSNYVFMFRSYKSRTVIISPIFTPFTTTHSCTFLHVFQLIVQLYTSPSLHIRLKTERGSQERTHRIMGILISQRRKGLLDGIGCTQWAPQKGDLMGIVWRGMSLFCEVLHNDDREPVYSTL